MSSAASVKDKLKNYAKKSGRLFGDVLTVYVGSVCFFVFRNPSI